MNWDYLIRTHTRELVGFGIAVCGLKPEDAEDVVQDAWVTAMGHGELIKNVPAFLKRIVKNGAAATFRKNELERRHLGEYMSGYGCETILTHVAPPLPGAQGGPNWRGRRSASEDRERNNRLARTSTRLRRQKKARAALKGPPAEKGF